MTIEKVLNSPIEGAVVEGLTGFQHRYSRANGANIHYVIGGSGPVIMLLHGFPFTWEDWRRILQPLADAGFTIVAPDLRGFGLSEKTEDGYSKANVAEDMRAIVREHGNDPVNLVTTDVGAMVGYAYASRHPQEVRRLVFAESLIPGFGLEERMNPATGGYWHFGFHGQVDVASMLVADREEHYLMPFWQMMSIRPDVEQTVRRRYLPYFSAPGGIRAAFEHYGTMLQDGRENREQFAGKLTMPVLVLAGEKGTPIEQPLQSVQQVADVIQSDVVPEAGHTFAEDNPSWVVERLVRFIG